MIRHLATVGRKNSLFDRKKPLDRGGATICCVTGEGFCLYVFVFLLPIKCILVHQLAGSFLGFII